MITKDKIVSIIKTEVSAHYNLSKEAATLDWMLSASDKLLELIANQQFLPEPKWQLCPKCYGDGNLARYNSPALMGINAIIVCDVCNGSKIIKTQ